MLNLGRYCSASARCAKWTASASTKTWSPLGDGMNAEVYALAFDSTGILYAGGNFTSAGRAPANRIAQWNGSAWMPLGSGMSAEVYELAIDGPGNLYACGSLTSTGEVTVNRVDNESGRIDFAATLLRPARPVSGKRAAATIPLSASEAGTSGLSVEAAG